MAETEKNWGGARAGSGRKKLSEGGQVKIQIAPQKNELELIDLMSDEGESVIDKVENGAVREKFKEVIKNCLDDREYQIITLRYGLIDGVPLPQRELAKKLHISRSYVSRIEKKALLKIKEEIKDKRFFTE